MVNGKEEEASVNRGEEGRKKEGVVFIVRVNGVVNSEKGAGVDRGKERRRKGRRGGCGVHGKGEGCG